MDKAVIKLKDVICDVDDLLDAYVTEALQHKMDVDDLQSCIVNTARHIFSRSNPILSRYKMKNKLKV